MQPTKPNQRSAFIPVCEPTLHGRELDYVSEAIKSGWVSSSGRFVNEFEERFAAYCGARFGISCTSGTTALHLSLLALGVGKGDEVVIPNFTNVATMNAVLYCGAVPVFVDVERDTWNLNVEALSKKITSKTKAVIPVHIFGQPCDMNEINSLCKSRGISVIEDAAQAHGATYQGKKVGALSEMSCFSFFSNKIITTGEGGMVLTSSEDLATKLRSYKNLCFKVNGPRDYWHEDLGYNYRMTNVQAAIGLGQLEQIDILVKARQKNASFYAKALGEISGIRLPVVKSDRMSVHWMNALCLDPKEFGATRDEAIAWLKECGIDTRHLFKPMHRQPFLKKYGIEDQGHYPVSEDLGENGFYLPSSSHLSEGEIARVAEELSRLRKKKRA